MKISKKERGFTLIELLVVVAVIGILSSIVLVSLDKSRAKGADTAVKSNLRTAANQAELFYLNNSSRYLPSGSFTAFPIGTCPVYSGTGTNMLSLDKNIAGAIAEAVKRGENGSSCYNSATAYAIAVGLKSSTSASWCVDSMGASRQVAFAPDSAIDSTSFSCK